MAWDASLGKWDLVMMRWKKGKRKRNFWTGNITFKGTETESASLYVGSMAFHEEIRSRRVKTEVIKGEGDQIMDSMEGQVIKCHIFSAQENPFRWTDVHNI